MLSWKTTLDWHSIIYDSMFKRVEKCEYLIIIYGMNFNDSVVMITCTYMKGPGFESRLILKVSPSFSLSHYHIINPKHNLSDMMSSFPRNMSEYFLHSKNLTLRMNFYKTLGWEGGGDMSPV